MDRTAPRLFVAPEQLPAAGELILEGPTQHYLGRVLRLGPGDRVVLLDGRGRICAATVTRFETAQVVLRLDAPDATPDATPERGEQPPLPGPRLVLLCGLLKGEKQDFVVQKATELGAAAIVPVACQRSVPQLGEERGEKRQQRWQRIALAAAQQCRRVDIPRVTAPASWSEAMTGHAAAPPAQSPSPAGESLRLLLYEGAAPPLGAVLERLPLPAAGAAPVIELLIGPEGGFTAAEVQSALAAGFVPVSLGPLTLRAETAAVVALGVVRYALSVRAATASPVDGDSA
ncbi:MAG: 16S rRNA (uracil(1498)-N(3))-methyltransferase [Polyangia bacterium]